MATTLPPSPARSELPPSAEGPSRGSEQPSVEEECAALVERIAGCEAFQKSSRLPALLRHLAKCTLASDRAGLSEQAIGRVVFGKGADFNPTEDSSVRVYMRQLRLRLHEYYQSLGEHERIIIEIPKGGYALAFHARHAHLLLPEPALSAAAIPPVSEAASHSLPQTPLEVLLRIPVWLPWSLFVVTLIVAMIGWARWARTASAGTPPWPISQVVEPGRQTTMVLADVSYALRLLGDRKFTLDEYADHKYINELIPKDATPGELNLFHYLQVSQITSMADARAVSAMTTLAGSLHEQIVIRSAKELNGSALASGNFIIVGAKNSNPWVELYENRMNFRFVEGGPNGARYIDNKNPRPGESAFYAVHESTGFSGEDYATISLLPGLGDEGSTLIVQGLRREGTDAAILFLSTPSLRTSLERKLRMANGGKLPRYFEALLRSHAVAGSATSIDCIAARPWTPR